MSLRPHEVNEALDLLRQMARDLTLTVIGVCALFWIAVIEAVLTNFR